MARPLAVEITGDIRKLKRALGEARGESAKTGSHFAGLKVAALAAGSAIVGGLAVGLEKSIHAAIDAEKVNARLNVAFKNAGLSANKYAGQVDKAASAGRRLGFTDEQTKDALGSLITATHSYRASVKQLGIAQDLARFKGVSLEQATKALTMAHAGSLRPIKQLGLEVSKVTDAQDAARTAYTQAKEALNAQYPSVTKMTAAQREQYDAAKANLDVQYQSDKAQATVIDHSKTFANVLKVTTGAVHGQADAYSKTAAGAMEQFRAQLQHIEIAIGEKLLPMMTMAIQYILNHWPQISEVIQKSWKTVKPILSGLADLVFTVVQIIRDHWSTIGPIVEAVGTSIKDTVKIIVDALRLVIDLLHGDWSKAWDDLKGIAGAAFDDVKTIIKTEATTLIALMLGLGTDLKNAVGDGLKGIGNAAWDVIKGIGGAITDQAKTIAGWGAGIGGDIKGDVVNGLKGIGNAAWDVINNIGDAIVNQAKAIIGWGAGIGGDIKGAVASGLAGIGNAAWDVINNIGGAILNQAKTIAGWGISIGAGILGGIVDALKGIGKAVAGPAKSIATSIANAVIDMLNDVIHSINKALVISFDTHIPGIGKIKIDPPDIPDIPHLASGGMLGAGQAAIVGERGPELFVPSRAGSVVPNGGGGMITVPLVVDGTVLASVLIDPLRNQAQLIKQRTGKAAFA